MGQDQASLGLAELAADLGDRLAGQELGGGHAAQQHDQRRVEQGNQGVEVRVAGERFGRFRFTVGGWAAADDVGEVDAGVVDAGAGQKLVEKVARRPDEGTALSVLVLAGGLADEEDVGIGRSLAGYGAAPLGGERAGSAAVDGGVQLCDGGDSGGLGGHACLLGV